MYFFIHVTLLKVLGHFIPLILTVQNWQHMHTCPCHKDVKGRRRGSSISNYIDKLQFLWICGILGNFVKNWYFVTYVTETHVTVIIFRKLHFVSTEFSVKYRFPFPLLHVFYIFYFISFFFYLFIYFFTVKSYVVALPSSKIKC